AHPRPLPPCPTRRSSDLTVLIAPLTMPPIPSQTTLIPRLRPSNASPMPLVTAVAASQAVCQTTPIASNTVDITVSRTLAAAPTRSEEHTSELQSRFDLVC